MRSCVKNSKGKLPANQKGGGISKCESNNSVNAQKKQKIEETQRTGRVYKKNKERKREREP
jgi:hypothetical protein